MGLIRAVVICAVLCLIHCWDSEVAKHPGETALFNTTWDAAPYTYLSWIIPYTNTTIITISTELGNFSNPDYEDRITLFSNGSLELRNLTLEDSGLYTVNMTTTEGPHNSTVFLLYVYVPVSDVRIAASATDVIEGDSVNFTCSALGSYLKFTWHAKSLPSFRSGELVLKPVSRYDDGQWRCKARNLLSSASSEWITLTVSYGPYVTLQRVPSYLYYYEGESVTMTCIVYSKPIAEITWFYNGDVLPFNGTEMVFNDLKKKHEGNYSCEAFNNKTMINKTSPLAVIIVKKQEVNDQGRPLSAWAIAAICMAAFAVAFSLLTVGIKIITKRL